MIPRFSARRIRPPLGRRAGGLYLEVVADATVVLRQERLETSVEQATADAFLKVVQNEHTLRRQRNCLGH